MLTYESLIEQFVYEEIPTLPTSGEMQFEAVSKEVFGTKQRRFGPMPSPEVQTSIREVIRNNDPLHFFSPWGSSKQQDDASLDILELFALKQLACLREGLNRYGKESRFSFRVEDLTDRYLFGDYRHQQIAAYRDQFSALTRFMLPKSVVHLESQYTSFTDFQNVAEMYSPVFYKYLTEHTPPETLYDIGWKGDIPQEQQQYYLKQYMQFFPNGHDYMWELAKYFSATLTRVKLNATGAPSEPSLLIAFTHPVPGANHAMKNRLHYRTLPERYTNIHKSPWLAKGYFLITESNRVIPRIASDGEVLKELNTHTLSINGVPVQADYILFD